MKKKTKKTFDIILESDYKDLINIFIEENVQFLLIGGYAVGLHGHPRPTKDLDLWVWANAENAQLVVKSLAKFGAPMQDISAQDFEKEGTVFQIGVAPVRIDVLTRVTGVKFEEAIQNAKMMKIEELNIPTISLQDLMTNKKASGRHRDLDDLASLEKILEKSQA
ncbi:MAG: nucleotidyltransferase [Fibromonadales bacterium]|nr:nucleotidyltransferase [Fibromonadales bacterium]